MRERSQARGGITDAHDTTRSELERLLTEALSDDPAPLAVASVVLTREPQDALFGEPLSTGRLAVLLELLGAYQRVTVETSNLLHARSISGAEPLLATRFSDVAVSALLREAYLDVQTVIALLLRGLDVQAAVVLRHLWELDLRALVVSADYMTAETWERATLASLDGEISAKRLERLRERAWSRGLSPATLMRRAAEIEISLEGGQPKDSPENERRVREMRAVYFGFLSDLAHGGSQMLLRSTVRDDQSATGDPLSTVGTPSDWCEDLVAHTLWLQARFWRSFLHTAVPYEPLDLVEHERMVLAGAQALQRVIDVNYADMLRSGIIWNDAHE